MSSFTVRLIEAIELTGGTYEVGTDGIGILTGGDIGIQYYPIFAPEYRATLTGKIVDHFYNREIGFETISIFKMKMRSHLNNIMPYYNKLYLSEKITFDPLSTINLKTVASGLSEQNVITDGETTANGTTTAASRTVTSETPQTMLAGNEDYATGAADANTQTASDSLGNEHNVSNAESTQSNDSLTTGYQGAASALLAAYREQLLNIDVMVLNALEPMFMQIYDTSDSYTELNGIY